MKCFVGIDFGTSGARAIVLNPTGQQQIQVSESYGTVPQTPDLWKKTLFRLLEQIPTPLRKVGVAISINGTSSTVLICDAQGNPVDQPILYNDSRGIEYQDIWQALVPPDHVAGSSTSSFAKLVWWSQQPQFAQATYFLHQADWLAFLLHGQLGISDYHNCLKLGYDVEQLTYPDWLLQSGFQHLLPQTVLVPGTPIAPILPNLSQQFEFPSDCQICAGTTDSIAAFLAADVRTPGQAVTSLGSTLVLKLLSETRIEHGTYGIYSHRLGNLWLVGGASNTGGAVLNHYFSQPELASLSQQIHPEQESPLDYYPLLRSGERFPINDPQLQPRLEPRPPNSVEFLQGLLESIARIERQGYDLLQELGATPLTEVYTAGGGAANSIWTQIRARQLNVPVKGSPHTEAAYGTALLAMRGILPR